MKKNCLLVPTTPSFENLIPATTQEGDAWVCGHCVVVVAVVGHLGVVNVDAEILIVPGINLVEVELDSHQRRPAWQAGEGLIHPLAPDLTEAAQELGVVGVA